jgi:putative FmdB family regulatory protein
MPIYNFSCQKCGKSFDLLVGVTKEETEIKCPHCGSREVKKNLSTFGIGENKDASSGDSSGGSCSLGTCPTCF